MIVGNLIVEFKNINKCGYINNVGSIDFEVINIII